jgi:hypothetical protein
MGTFGAVNLRMLSLHEVLADRLKLLESERH